MSGRQFVIKAAPSVSLARTFLSNQIGRCRRGGSVAVITPSVGRYATNVLQSVAETPTRQGNGPYPISWERSEQEVLTTLLGQLDLAERASVMVADQAVQRLEVPAVVTAVRSWLGMQQLALGRTEVLRKDVEDRIGRAVSHGRRFVFRRDDGLCALTVHGAKNREFDGVVVLWSYAVAGSAEQKRRLLYNAVTRAKRWCLVLAEGERLLEQAPFVG
ncbi:ATP-binding domain-containing protein [Azospirillum canadense]|uniref:ATP-binding domain-containing protein n=1 Tax=Azospirillum canadense TaxID=403962 RepID=UPI00222618C1|nr:ATP-binding domain-containing protein [Azospirillum canadense]MCW2240422.1 hypothetical protein [Azospirillum canadense]